MQAFDSYMVLFDSGAGGHVGGSIAAVSGMVATYGGAGWVFGCRAAGLEPGPRGGPLRRIIEVTLLCTFGEPAPEAVALALEAVARRHMVVYRLVERCGSEKAQSN